MSYNLLMIRQSSSPEVLKRGLTKTKAQKFCRDDRTHGQHFYVTYIEDKDLIKHRPDPNNYGWFEGMFDIDKVAYVKDDGRFNEIYNELGI